MSVSINQILRHSELPGVMAYFFDDGTVIVSDASGRESKAQNFSEDQFKALGWEPTTSDSIDLSAAIARDMLFEAAKRLPRSE